MPEDLTTTTGIVALAAGGVAVIALIFCIVLAVKLRRLRASQLAVLGDGKRDLVEIALRMAAQQVRVTGEGRLDPDQAVEGLARQPLIYRHQPCHPFGVTLGRDMIETIGMADERGRHGSEARSATPFRQ